MTCPYKQILGCDCIYQKPTECPEFHKYADAGHNIILNDNDHDKARFHIESSLVDKVELR